MHVDEPIQYFYSFDFTLPQQNGTNFMRLPNTAALQSLGFPTETGKLTIFAQAQNLLLVRLTNYADKFDNATADVPYVNINQLAQALWLSANPGSMVPNIDITETSLSGNQPYSNMQMNKIPWKGVDDDVIVPPVLPQDKSKDVIALEAQRIRVFKIMYQTSSTQASATFLSA
jgi:hypothetical protein